MKFLRTAATSGSRSMSQLPGGLEGFGQDVFTPAVMQNYVDADVYTRHLESIASGEQPKKDDKNAIATGMMKWAMEKGSTQFAHWFSPIRGANGLKKDAFIGASRAVTSRAWPRPRRCGASTFSLSLVRRSHTSRSHPLFCPLSLPIYLSINIPLSLSGRP